MRKLILSTALGAATATTASFAQTAADWRTSPVMPGSWAYRATATGSEAAFTDARATRRMVVKCSRATRRVSLSVTSAIPAAAIQISASEMERSLPAVFDAQGFQITSELAAQDTLLDAITFSRGRFSVTFAGGAALILPPWPEIARSIEDCRN